MNITGYYSVMFALLIVFVVVIALFAVLAVANGPGFGPRRGRTVIIEREVPRERIVEREYDG